jgi:Fatty acid desaturase
VIELKAEWKKLRAAGGRVWEESRWYQREYMGFADPQAGQCGGVAVRGVAVAHCVQEASFPMPVANDQGTDQHMETDWAVHQVQTTVDFARRNPLISWFVGGLNFQIEHHLLARICHVHYPALSKIVEQTCHEFGVRYTAHKSFFGALVSHYRWLVTMGKPVT